MNNRNRDLGIGLVYGVAIALPLLLLGAVISSCGCKDKESEGRGKDESEVIDVEQVLRGKSASEKKENFDEDLTKPVSCCKTDPNKKNCDCE